MSEDRLRMLVLIKLSAYRYSALAKEQKSNVQLLYINREYPFEVSLNMDTNHVIPFHHQ